jgi:hypothetical protein
MATNLVTKKLDLPERKLVPIQQILALILNIDTIREGTVFMD